MFNLSKESSIQEICLEFHQLCNKWGYMDGADLLSEEATVIQYACNKLVDFLGKIGDWQPKIVGTGTHNPFYIYFENTKTKKQCDYWDLDVKVRREFEKKMAEARKD